MSYYDDEATIGLLEDYDDDESFYEDDYDDDDYDDDEGLAESNGEGFFPRHRRRARLSRARTAKARRLSTGVKGIRRATVRTPAGKASIRLPMAVVTKEELKKSFAKVGMEIRKNGKAITRLSSNIRRVDKSSLSRVSGLEGKLSKFEKNTNQKIDEAKQQAILPLLRQSKPKLKTITLDDGKSQTIKNAEYESINNTLLLLSWQVVFLAEVVAVF